MNGWMVQWYAKRPAWATRIVAEPPGATVPESKLPTLVGGERVRHAAAVRVTFHVCIHSDRRA
jgi:hypothetical protein